MASIAKRLTEPTSDIDNNWTSRHEDISGSLKAHEMKAPLLRAFDTELPVMVSADASCGTTVRPTPLGRPSRPGTR